VHRGPSHGGYKLTLSLPTSREDIHGDFRLDAEYPVDSKLLRRMLAPCFIHMLDAFFSSLVMEKLAAHNVTDFVAIHDCWLVPEKVICNGQERNGQDVFHAIIDDAAYDWYRGLGPCYERLFNCVQGHTRFDPLFRNAWELWKRRISDNYAPKFLFKPD
jgi:hypothetical protein